MRPAGLPSGSVISSLVGDQLRHITGAQLAALVDGMDWSRAKMAARGSITKARRCWGDRAAFSEFASILRDRHGSAV
jgi:hypothetical protein